MISKASFDSYGLRVGFLLPTTMSADFLIAELMAVHWDSASSSSSESAWNLLLHDVDHVAIRNGTIVQQTHGVVFRLLLTGSHCWPLCEFHLVS